MTAQLHCFGESGNAYKAALTLELSGYDWEPVFVDFFNGATGIAVGMATNVPPHNLNEVVDACIAVVDDPDIGIDGLMQHVPGPDLPTAALINGARGIREAYTTGRGRIYVRAKVQIETDERSNKQTITTDEETSLIHAAYLYYNMAYDAGWLQKPVNGVAIIERLNLALELLRRHEPVRRAARRRRRPARSGRAPRPGRPWPRRRPRPSRASRRGPTATGWCWMPACGAPSLWPP